MSNVKGTATRHAKKARDKYPAVKEIEENGCVVLFTSCTDGVVLASGNSTYRAGYRSESWDAPQFRPFYGTVTISTLEEK